MSTGRWRIWSGILNLELQGKVALVTGSSRGIGLAIARALQQEGCTVVLNGRDDAQLQAAAQHIGASGIAGDVAREDGAQTLVREVLTRHGGLDILVSNVGSGTSLPPGTEDWAEWERMLGLNLRAAVNTVSAARPALSARRGVALCISSICGSAALGAPLAYSAAKAALDSYVRGISRVLAAEGVRINALAPGNVLFGGSSWERHLQKDPQRVQDMLAREVALKRFGSAEEIADVAAFLCSARSSFMTGEVLVADGGQLRS
jgi:3-oxoacyl-[acyl-carrier protein] reductase